MDIKENYGLRKFQEDLDFKLSESKESENQKIYILYLSISEIEIKKSSVY